MTLVTSLSLSFARNRVQLVMVTAGVGSGKGGQKN